ncbi:MAG TPA: hypothetical protein VGA73_17705 [Candidatus Binatia bacterium]
MEELIEVLIPAVILVYPLLQFLAIRWMRGFWLFLALVPLAVMGCVLAVTVYAFYRDSNVWPIVLILTSPVVMLSIGLLLVIHAFVSKWKLRKTRTV